MALDAGGSGGGSYSPPRRQKVAPQTVMRARTAPVIARQVTMRPKPAPAPYSPPPRPPVSSNNSGQYSGGGGRPVDPPAARQGPINRPGRQQAIERRNNSGGGGNNRRSSPGPGPGNNQPQPQQPGPGSNQPQQPQEPQKPNIPGIDEFLMGDETYQSQLSALQKELEDYILANKNQQGDLAENFSLAQSRMGDERLKALESMGNDFAARGLLNSSEFMNAIGDYNTSYQTKLGDLTRDRDSSLEDLLESLGLYRRTNESEIQNARAEAIRRRAEQYGIGG